MFLEMLETSSGSQFGISLNNEIGLSRTKILKFVYFFFAGVSITVWTRALVMLTWRDKVAAVLRAYLSLDVSKL